MKKLSEIYDKQIFEKSYEESAMKERPHFKAGADFAINEIAPKVAMNFAVWYVVNRKARMEASTSKEEWKTVQQKPTDYWFEEFLKTL